MANKSILVKDCKRYHKGRVYFGVTNVSIKLHWYLIQAVVYVNYTFLKFVYNCINWIEGVHQTLPPHIFSIQIKSGACDITGLWGRVHNKNKRKPNPNPSLNPLPSIVFHNKICVFTIITALSFLWLTHGLFTIWGGNVT